MDKNNRSKARPVVVCEDPSLTKQSFKDKVDINKIVARHRKTGILSTGLPSSLRKPIFADFSGVTDYRTMIHKSRQIDEWFMSIPSEIRRRFKNDPQAIMEFVGNADNKQECIELGLLPKPINVKYVDKNKADITEEVIAKRGLFKEGILVNKQGEAILDPKGEAITRDDLISGVKTIPNS